MSKTAKWLIGIAAAILLLALACFCLQAVWRGKVADFYGEPLTMPQDGKLTLSYREDGTVQVTWPPSPDGEDYLAELLPVSDGTVGDPIFSAYCEDHSCLLPASVSGNELVLLNVYARRSGVIWGREFRRLSEEPLSVIFRLDPPRASELCLTPDPEKGCALLSWAGTSGDDYRLYARRAGEEPLLLRELTGNETLLSFGEGGDLPMPLPGETIAFWLEASRETPELSYPGLVSEEASVCREDLLGTEPAFRCAAIDDSSFLLSWDETKGERCLIEMLDPDSGEWQTVAELPMDGERVYDTGHLPPFGTYRYRLSVLGGQARPDGTFAVTPEEVEVQTAETLMYAAVWPLTELDLFAGPDGEEKIGTLSPLRAACVLGEENGYLLVGTPEGSGYVDENYCMIDLPDYVGELCDYRIWNSVSSLYKVHGCPIRDVTGTVIRGYEGVALPEGGYLVPLLYPTAQKLIEAAKALLADGYRLRIYDSFRPHVATRSVYELTTAVLEEPVSEEEDALTYRQLMTGERYQLWDFLAANVSKHNRGIAMDVALLRVSDGEELEMQSVLHDLSWYSATPYNDAEADLLASYMVAAGFGTLYSEWWHFQDMEALAALEPPCRSEGVTPEGWRADDTGWRYRCADGSYLAGESREIDGRVCRFGEDGYLIPES